mmetsp:Transcript_2836/g.3197  ORF Transcript_2836/g.3197 Transcript_2836/m.3197 type:complete len:444 (+) Transcript_2836:230-1561(+)
MSFGFNEVPKSIKSIWNDDSNRNIDGSFESSSESKSSLDYQFHQHLQAHQQLSLLQLARTQKQDVEFLDSIYQSVTKVKETVKSRKEMIIACPRILSYKGIMNHTFACRHLGPRVPLLAVCSWPGLRQDEKYVMFLIDQGLKHNISGRGGLLIENEEDDKCLNSHKKTNALKELFRNGCFKILKKILDKNLIFREDVVKYGFLYDALSSGCIDTIRLVLDIDPDAIGAKDNYGLLPLNHSLCKQRCHKDSGFAIYNMLLEKGIERLVGGEKGIGGLFSSFCDQEAGSITTLEQLHVCCGNRRDLSVSYVEEYARGLPLLHAALESIPVSLPALHDFIFRLAVLDEDDAYLVANGSKDTKTVNGGFWTKDSSNRLPVHVACDVGLAWKNGMRVIIERNEAAIEEVDECTNLFPFALAASGENADLTTIYELCLRRPDIVTSRLS